ncbi:MAG: hypothetical protein PSV13_02400 [Lacunisphaera sp.]|nr:hypothetical protein [Lacunisphaera sp.]
MKPFLLGKKPVDSAPLRPVHAHPPLPRNGLVLQSAPAPTPTVEVVKEGDKVVRLVITCLCGERIEVDCLYPAGS